MKKIVYYEWNGNIKDSADLNEKTIKDCHGMKIKCKLIDGTEKVGFANCYYSFEEKKIVVDSNSSPAYIAIEVFVNIDEETHKFVGDINHRYDIEREKVFVSSILHIDAILYSGLRWGVTPTNKFNLNIDN